MADPFIHRLEQFVGATHVLVDPDEVAGYEQDWTGRWSGRSMCVVRPASTEQVVGVVTACASAGIAITVQGGNTGLVGGGVPADGAVVLSTERLDRIGEVDADTGRVLVGAGAPLARVAAAAEDAGWEVGVDLASRDAATIGGMVATDAGGSRVVAHGSMRQHVLGMEVVLADGTIARPWLEGLPKDTAGYDLRQVMVGSEGTLGIITQVLLQLVPPAPTAATLLLGSTTAGTAGLVAALQARIADSGARLTACELMTASGCGLVADVLGVTSPVTTPVALLIDLAGEVGDDLLADLAALGHGETVVGLDPATRQRLWRLREGHTEAISVLGIPVKLDVAVPLEQLAWFLDAVPATVATVLPPATCVLFGHAVEGNIHVNVTGAAAHAERIEESVYGLLAEVGGTISAEHGVGRAKVDHLHLTRDEGSLAAMRRLKQALDPDELLNPGVVLPRKGRI